MCQKLGHKRSWLAVLTLALPRPSWASLGIFPNIWEMGLTAVCTKSCSDDEIRLFSPVCLPCEQRAREQQFCLYRRQDRLSLSLTTQGMWLIFPEHLTPSGAVDDQRNGSSVCEPTDCPSVPVTSAEGGIQKLNTRYTFWIKGLNLHIGILNILELNLFCEKAAHYNGH